MTNDGANTLTYDAENHAVTAAGATYTYGGNGLRVKKLSGGTTTVYVFSGSKVRPLHPGRPCGIIAEYDNGAAPGSPTREYIYSGGALLAKIEAGATNYYHSDHLSARVITDSSGTSVGTRGHYPYGENWYASGVTTKLKFTTYERDSESGNDFALARYHVNRLGRFSSPDPIPGALDAPQTLNRYAYARNDPVNLMDPRGLQDEGTLYSYNNAYGQQIGYAVMFVYGSYSAALGGSFGSMAPPKPRWRQDRQPHEQAPDFPNPAFTPPTPFGANQPAPPLECRPEFIAQAKAAWQRAFLGNASTEAGFMIRGSWSSPTYVPFPYTNENRAISFRKQANDVAFLHTHPNSGSPVPSGPPAVDLGYRRPGDGGYVTGYTASREGLYMSDPAAKNKYVLVRPGLDWLKPCD